jgi:hypothetical protein
MSWLKINFHEFQNEPEKLEAKFAEAVIEARSIGRKKAQEAQKISSPPQPNRSAVVLRLLRLFAADF